VYTPYMACAGMYKFTKFMLEIVIKVLCNASDNLYIIKLISSGVFAIHADRILVIDDDDDLLNALCDKKIIYSPCVSCA
ncbi:MAG: hypothetical protein XD78_2011, partial [Desulfotomaculum sp. 46_296]